MAKTARQGFIAAALFAFLGLAALVSSAFGWSRLWIGAVMWLPIAGIHLASALALRRRERAGATPRTQDGGRAGL